MEKETQYILIALLLFVISGLVELHPMTAGDDDGAILIVAAGITGSIIAYIRS